MILTLSRVTARIAALWLPMGSILWPLLASAQTLSITNGIRTYSALTNTTVTMTGRCELHVTATNSPIPGCTINLNSADAWVLLPNLRPSVVSTGYLSQFFVNGASAVLNGNIRLSEYAMGTMVIPHSPSIMPLQIFSGPNFLGASTNLALYTYYTNNVLGAFNRNMGSFRLKRGYMATFAQNFDGTGASQVFVAQDADLDVGFLSANLNQPISFVRVFPWRWTAKKGWAGGSLIDNTAPLWWYEWGNSSVSTLDREFAPMKWSSSSGTSSVNNKQNSTHVLGYNEPDSTAQANMTTAQAIADWPTLMKWGMRAGAPAASDSGVTGQGLDWINSFMSQATNLGYRVDFIPIHWYKCGQTPSQLTNYLYSVYQKYKRPMWVTEWNDGASWCSPLPGSQAADATAISNFVSTLESCPFVERYSIYQYFDPSSNLNLLTTNSPAALTPAGVVYLNTPSKVAYTQVWPKGGGRSTAQFHFENDTLDSSGYANNGFAVGDPNYVNGQVGQAVALDGSNSFIQLPPNMANSANFTFAGWVYWNGGANWQRIFDFGEDQTHYLFLTPSSGNGTLRFAIKNGGSEQNFETTALPVGQWTHVAVTLSSGSASIYTNGVLAASSSSITIAPSNFNPNVNYLGKSQFPADPLFSGGLDEVQIADYALTAAQIASLMTDSPPQFATNLIVSGSATQSMAYSSSIAGTATDADPGDTLTYSKVSGPAWLNVAADGTLTGTPTPSDGGTNIFTVRVTDAAGASAFAGVSINTIAFNANGVWNVDTNGAWSDTNNWSGGAVANGAGFTADFSTINITADRAVTLDLPRSIGTLKFGDTSGTQLWTLASSGGSALTLDTGAGTSPSVVVNQNTATISTPLAGVNGFTQTGAGTLTLSGVNTYSGTTIVSAGTLVVGGSGQLGGGTHAGNITDNATLLYNSSAAQILSGVISGNGTVTQVSGTLMFSGNNTYSGGTTVNGGTLALAKGGSTGAIRYNLTINVGATVNLTATDALGYTNSGSGITFVTNVNLVGGTLNNAVNGNNGFNTKFNLTGGTMSSTGGGAYNFDGATGAGVNSLASSIISTISAPVDLRSPGVVFSTASGSVPGGIDLKVSGAINNANSSGTGFLVKSGAGTLSLSGVNTYTGLTTVNSGTLLVSGTVPGAVTVSAGAILGGGGTIGGVVTIGSGGTLGAPGITTLSLNSSPVLGGTVVAEINRNGVSPLADLIAVVGNAISYGGLLVVSNIGAVLQSGDAFTLFTATSHSGNFASIAGSPGSGLHYSFANGVLSVLSNVASNPTNITFSVSGRTLALSWAADHLGWYAQSNSGSVAITSSWFDIPGSQSGTTLNIPVNPVQPAVYYRLRYP